MHIRVTIKFEFKGISSPPDIKERSTIVGAKDSQLLEYRMRSNNMNAIIYYKKFFKTIQRIYIQFRHINIQYGIHRETLKFKNNQRFYYKDSCKYYQYNYH